MKWTFLQFKSTINKRPHQWHFITIKSGIQILTRHMKEEHNATLSSPPIEIDLLLDPDTPEAGGTESYVFKISHYDVQIKPEHVMKMRHLLRYAYKADNGFVTFPTRDATIFVSKHMFEKIKHVLDNDTELQAKVDAFISKR